MILYLRYFFKHGIRMKDQNIILEICTAHLEAALAAAFAGADRLEFCSNLGEGGTTPSLGSVRTLLSETGTPVMVMIRPRGGNFEYTEKEFASMCRDTELLRDTGISGIVFGILDRHGEVDMGRCSKLMEIAGSLDTTFHRAFDATSDLHSSLEKLCALGFRRVLTSGGRNTAGDGKEILGNLVKQAAGRIVVMPGGGVRSHNIADLWQHTTAVEFHMAPLRKSSPNAHGMDDYMVDTHEIEKTRVVLKNLIQST